MAASSQKGYSMVGLRTTRLVLTPDPPTPSKCLPEHHTRIHNLNALTLELSSLSPRALCLAHLHQIATVAFGVVDLEGDKVLAFNAGAVAVIDPHAFTLEAQLEQLALRNGHLHLGSFAGHLCINDVVGG